jgi:hypothetical protein
MDIPVPIISAIASITGPTPHPADTIGQTIMVGIRGGTTAIQTAAITTATATGTQTAEPATPSTNAGSGTGARQRLGAPCATTGTVKDMWSPAAAI